MLRHGQERVLLVGDSDRVVLPALIQAIPAAQITPVPSYFDAIAELTNDAYTTVLAAVEPIERRPEAAVRTLRQLASDARLLLFGQPALEPLSRKMLDFGCDDYIITPPSAVELQQMFGTPPMRLVQDQAEQTAESPVVAASPTRISLLIGLPLAEVLLEALSQHPQDAAAAAVRQLNVQIGPTMHLDYLGPSEKPSPPGEGLMTISHTVRSGSEQTASLHLTMPRDEEETAARHFLAQLAHLISRVASLQDRHVRLQKLAITDDLTGLYNGRYFWHFLHRIIDKARTMRFPVTLLLFDIDDFKHYNDLYGHGVGDQILRQTAALMRRCCRDHDLVARISGDEFAVVFWEKEGPRQPREPHPQPPGRTPQTPLQIFERFRRLLATEQFQGLGKAGQGLLTISGGLAVYPYDAHDAEGLIEEADRRLMFGAKRAGKNSIVLVGDEEKLKSSDAGS